MQIVLVAALDEGRAIGGEGDLLWRLPEDLKHFKSVTMGHPVILGRRTYESIGSPLPGRKNIVLTRQSGFEAPGCVVVSSLQEALKEARRDESGVAMILGGATVYEQALPMADRLILTVVHGRYEGDTFFPLFDSEEWEIASVRNFEADEKNPSDMTFVELHALVERPRVIEEAAQELPEILQRKGPTP